MLRPCLQLGEATSFPSQREPKASVSVTDNTKPRAILGLLGDPERNMCFIVFLFFVFCCLVFFVVGSLKDEPGRPVSE